MNEDDLFAITRHLGHQRQRASLDQRSKSLLQYLKETLGDPLGGLQFMIERAQDNLLRYKAKLPLIGHLLPYLTAEEATQEGLNFREAHGWIEEETNV
jgi:hypothetical protein